MIENHNVFTEYDNVYLFQQYQVMGLALFFTFQITLLRYTLHNVENAKKAAKLLKKAQEAAKNKEEQEEKERLENEQPPNADQVEKLIYYAVM